MKQAARFFATLSRMKLTLAALLIILLSAVPVVAGGLGTPTLSPPISTTRFFDPDRLLTTGGAKISTSGDVVVEPEVGLVYRATEQEFSGGIEQSTHLVHAQAGWKISLAQTFYLSAAAKLPVLTVGSASSNTGQDLGTKYGYDFMRPFRNSPTWTGEMGVHLSSHTDLTLYFDQSEIPGSIYSSRQQEDRVGTRIIFRFE